MPRHRRAPLLPGLFVAFVTCGTLAASGASATGAAAVVGASTTVAIAQARPDAASPAASAPGAAPKPAPAAGDAAPPTELIDAAGLRKLLAAQQGRIVVLNLWATWCVPCLREIPDLLTLAREGAPRGVELIGLSMDEPSALAGQVEPFRRKNFPAFHTWLRATADMDPLVSVVDPAWNEILPTTYVIGRDGKVAHKIQGKRTLEQFRELLKEVP